MGDPFIKHLYWLLCFGGMPIMILCIFHGPKMLQGVPKTAPRPQADRKRFLRGSEKAPLKRPKIPIPPGPMGYPCFGRQGPMGYPSFGCFGSMGYPFVLLFLAVTLGGMRNQILCIYLGSQNDPKSATRSKYHLGRYGKTYLGRQGVTQFLVPRFRGIRLY